MSLMLALMLALTLTLISNFANEANFTFNFTHFFEVLFSVLTLPSHFCLCDVFLTRSFLSGTNGSVWLLLAGLESPHPHIIH